MIEIKGKIEKKGELIKLAGKEFRKQELVIDVSGEKYPTYVTVEFVQDSTRDLEPFNVGDLVTVAINIGGRKWINHEGEAKYFNSLKGWKISASGTPSETPATDDLMKPFS